MPPITRSMTIGKTQEEGVEKGEGSSSPKPEGDLLSMLSKMMSQMEAWISARLEESDVRALASQNTLFEELNTLKEKQRVRPPTSMRNVVPNEVPEEFVEEEAYEGWQGGNLRNRDENRGYGRFGMGNQRGRVGLYGDDRGGYESRYHEDGLDRGSSGERAPKSHEEWHSRRVRNHASFKGFERPIEEEVSYRARLRPTYPHGGVDTHQMGNSSSHLTTSSSFHFSHEPLDVY